MPRFLRKLALVTVTTVLTSLSASADLRDLENDEPKKILAALDLVEEAYKKAGKLNSKMADELNAAGDPGGAAGQIPYEDANATFADAIKKMRDKVGNGHVKISSEFQRGARTRNKKGTDADIVLFADAHMKRLCTTPDDGRRFFSKLRLGASLANEMVHVWQIFAGNDARECDAERDSDTATILFLCEIEAAITGAANPNAIDGQACPKLKKCLMDYSVDTTAEWDYLQEIVPRYKDYYEKRRTTIFDTPILAGFSWGKRYSKGAAYRGPIMFSELTAPQQVRMSSPDGMTDRFYVLPAGKAVLTHVVTENENGQTVLTIFAQDATTLKLCVFTYTDTTGDYFPELTPVVAQASTAAGSNIPQDSLFMLPFLPGDTAGQSGWTLLDTQEGTFYQVPIDGNTMLPAQPTFDAVFTTPECSDAGGGFFYHYEALELGPLLESWVFTAIPNCMAHPDQQAIALDIDLGTGVWSLVGSGLVAQTLFPTNQAGIEQLDVGLPVIDLFGYPGPPGQVTFFDIGVGPAFIVVPPTLLDSSGKSGPIPVQPLPPGLFMVETTDGTFVDQKILFQPPFGEDIGSALVLESGDSELDRLELTDDPPRLHVFQGVPGDPKTAAQHIYELVLEGEDPQNFESWDSTNGRLITGAEQDFGPFLLVPEPQMPLYVQTLRDLDGDTQDDDAIVVRGTQTFTPNPDYTIEVMRNVATAPLIQIISLSYIPVDPIVVDIDFDGDLDLELYDLILGEPHCYLNNGLGQFSEGTCFESFCFGDGGDQLGCTDCPCANNAPIGTLAGCLNSAGTSCRLQPSGSDSLFAADLRFECSGVAPNSAALLISANEALPASPSQPCFGFDSGITTAAMDGIRCVGQGLLRHGVRPSDASGDIGVTTNGWGTPDAFFGLSSFAAGSTRHFQVFYRDASSFGCGSGLNSSQGVRVLFTP